MLHKIFIFLFTICLVKPPLANASMRISGGLGLGSSETSNEITESEGPLTQKYSVEFIYHSKLIMGVEHIRSFSLTPMSTAISFSGVFAQWYLSSVPTPYVSAEEALTNQISFRDLGYFVGMGVGLGQSARLPNESGKSSNAAGLYISPTVGLDLQLTKSFGLRSALLIALSVVGSGNLSSFSLVESVYWGF